MNPILIVKDKKGTRYLRLDLHQDTAERAREIFSEAADSFGQSIEELIPFDPGYKLEDDQCFEINDFPISEDLISFCKQPISADRLDPAHFDTLSINAVVGYDVNKEAIRLYFQNFDSRRVLVPGRRFAVWPISDASTFAELTAPVLLLDANITAVWEAGTLRFRSFHLAKQIFDLSSYFAAATDEQVTHFSAHHRFRCSDLDRLLKTCNAWCRTKISLILRSGILDHSTGELLRDAASSVQFELDIDDEDRIVLPEDKRKLRSLLQFLDEDVYRGLISQRILLSSGKRQIP
jgi:hypothetical protein